MYVTANLIKIEITTTATTTTPTNNNNNNNEIQMFVVQNVSF